MSRRDLTVIYWSRDLAFRHRTPITRPCTILHDEPTRDLRLDDMKSPLLLYINFSANHVSQTNPFSAVTIYQMLVMFVGERTETLSPSIIRIQILRFQDFVLFNVRLSVKGVSST